MTPEFLCERFRSGLAFEQFRAEALDHREVFQSFYDALDVPDEVARAFRSLVDRHGGRVHVLALAEDWCADAARALPLLARLSEAVEGLTLRVLHAEHPDNEALARRWPKGARHPIPVVVFLDADFEEIGHWIERSASGDAFLKAKRAELADLEQREFFKQVRPLMMDAFRQRLWRDTLDEWLQALAAQRLQSV